MNKSDVVIFSTADWNAPYWTNKQHMAKCFADLGHRVLYVESIGLRKPKIQSRLDWKRVFRRMINGFGRASRVEPNIWVVSPLVIPFSHGNKLVKSFNKFKMTNAIGKVIQEQNFLIPLVWTYHPFILEVTRKIFKNSKLIYHCVDDLSSVPGVDKELFIVEEKKLLDEAHVVFVTNKLLEAKCKIINKNTFFLPNVVDYEHFSWVGNGDDVPQDLIEIPEPRVVYMGALSEFKIDFKMLDEVIQALPECSFIFIGEEIEGQSNPILKKISKYKNSYFIGYKPYKLLPTYLSNMRVGIHPVIKNSYTDSMAPMKLLEYIAAGLPVVVSEMDYLNTLGVSEKIYQANTSEEFISGIKMASQLSRICHSDRMEIIKENTWTSRINVMLKIISSE